MENNENNIQESNSLKKLKMLGASTTEDIHLKSDAEVKGKFWDNVWYRHKWAIIFVGIGVIMLIILAIMIATDDKKDMNIIYVGPEYVLHKVEAMNEKLGMMCDDYDGNGEIIVNFPTLIYQNEEQREQLKKLDPDKLITTQANNEALGQFQAQLMSGELVIYLIDPALYETNAKGLCVPLNEILGEGYTLKDGVAYDDRAVNFAKTDFAIHFSDFDVLPNDTLMCIVKTVNTDSEFYEDSCDFFKKIIDFKAS